MDGLPSTIRFSSGLDSLPNNYGAVSPAVLSQALHMLEALCTELPEKNLSHKICTRDPASKFDACKLLLRFREYTPEDGNDARIILVFLYWAYSEADPGNFPNPVPTSADPSEYTLENLLPKMNKAFEEVPEIAKKLYKALSDLSCDLINVFYVLFVADGTRAVTPKSNLTPHGAFEPQRLASGRKETVKTKCHDREREKCALTGYWSTMELDQLVDQLDEMFPDGVIPNHSELEVAHIVPVSMGIYKTKKDKTDPAKIEERRFFWDALSLFAPATRAQLGEDPDSITNVMLLTLSAHREFSSFKVWLKETEVEHVYQIETFTKITQKYQDFADFRNDVQPPPDVKYIRLHGALANVLHAAGAVGYMTHRVKEDTDLERQGVLAADGSSDLTGLFFKYGLGVC